MSETTAPVTRVATVASARSRRARISLLALQIVLAIFYAGASALPKLMAHPSAVESFGTLGWGSAGMYIIGALELTGAIGLLIPILSSVAATSLSALMVGAFITQLAAFGGEYAATPLVLIVPLVVIAWARRKDVAGLTRLVRQWV